MKEHVPAALGTYLCPRVSPGETTWFLECGFILHPMANAVIRALSSVKGLKQEQRRLFLGTLGQCWAPYQVLAPLGVLTFLVQNAKGGSLPRGRRRAKWWKNRAWVWQKFLESHVLPVWFLFVCLFLFLSPEWIKVAGRLHRRLPWNHLQATGIWTHRGSGGQWGPFSGGALASPPERWVSFRAGHQKGFVSGKGLWTSGGWSGRHPFKVGEPRRSATWLWGYGLPLFRIVGTGGQDTGNRISVSLRSFPVLRLTFPHHLVPNTQMYLLSWAFDSITEQHCSASQNLFLAQSSSHRWQLIHTLQALLNLSSSVDTAPKVILMFFTNNSE